MTSKEKILAALAHEPGPVPIDFGSNAVTGMHCSVVADLRDYYGLEKHPVFINEPFQMLGEVEDDLREAIGIDTDAIYPRSTIFGFDLSGEKEWKTPWGQIVRVPEGFVTTKDKNGDELIYPKGDTTAPASGRMPTNGYFFDAIVRQEPIDEDNLNVEDNLEEFGPVEQADLDYYAGEVAKLAGNSRGVMANFGGTALGDIALVPAPFLKHPKGIRDITEWYVSTVARPDYVHEIFARQTEMAIKNLSRISETVGNAVDAMFLCGTDFGTQASTFCSPDTFRELYLPYYRQMTDWIHANTNWKIFKHSCGAVSTFMPLFMEAGIDIINPVQISAVGMDPEHLKKEFGNGLVFWGGGVDTQKTMAFGSPEEVKAEVQKSCRVFGEHGGFVFNAVHNVQAKSAVENVVAMIDAVRDFNKAGA